MADTIKTLNTRIISKNVTLEQATTGTWKPYEGEIVLAKVEVAKADQWGNISNVPTFLMKVGAKDSNGNLIAIKDLQWTHAPASDVYSWAKQNKLAVTTSGSGNVVTGITATDAGITITKANVATTEALAQANSAITALQNALSEEKTARENADKALSDRLDSVEESLADGGTIHELIDGAKAQADEGVRLAGVAQNTIDTYKTANDAAVAKKADKTALEAEQTARETADNKIREDYASADNTVKSTLIGASGDAKTANTIYGAKAYADDVATTKANAAKTAAEATAAGALSSAKTELQGKIDAVDDRVDAAIEAYEAADTKLGNRITTLEDKVKDVTTVMDFRGAVSAKPADGAAGYQKGDVVVVTDGNDAGKEFVYDGAKWHEFGSTSATDTALSTLQSDFNTFKNTTVPDTYATKDALGAEATARANADSEIRKDFASADTTLRNDLTAAIATAKSEAISDAASKDTALHTVISKEIDDDVKASADAIKTAYEAADASTLTSAKGYTDAEIDKVEKTISDLDKAYKQADSTLSGRVKAIEDDYLKAADKTALQSNINTVSGDLTDLSNTVSANKTDVDTNFVKVVENKLTVGGLTIIFDCGGVEEE